MPGSIHAETDTVETLCARYNVDMAHARHVALLAEALFDILQPLHALPASAKDLARTGALLHDVGVSVDEANHHLAARDIIVASALQGFDPASRAVMACMAAFHRKLAQPQSEPLFSALTPSQQTLTLALSALLRIADGLDYSQSHTTELDEMGDWRLEIGERAKSPIPNPQSPISLRVRGPFSHDDAARAMKKADLWATLFPPLSITGYMTRAGITLDDTLGHAGRRILRYQSEPIASSEWHADMGALPKPHLVHDWRVATRRMRSTLRVFGPYYKNKIIEPIVKGVRDMAATLARVREWDLAVTALKNFERTCESPAKSGAQLLLEDWRAERRLAREETLHRLCGDRQARWFSQFTTFVQTDAYDRAPEPGKPRHVRHIIDAVIAQHLADVRAYDTLPAMPGEEELHALRIAVKRLRYVTDGLRDVLPAARADQIIAACVAAQDEYGLIHDAHFIAARALAYVAQHRAEPASDARVRCALTFAQAQQKIAEQHALSWRDALAPLLML
jgi:CHAD domain-containing protein